MFEEGEEEIPEEVDCELALEDRNEGEDDPELQDSEGGRIDLENLEKYPLEEDEDEDR